MSVLGLWYRSRREADSIEIRIPPSYLPNVGRLFCFRSTQPPQVEVRLLLFHWTHSPLYTLHVGIYRSAVVIATNTHCHQKFCLLLIYSTCYSFSLYDASRRYGAVRCCAITLDTCVAWPSPTIFVIHMLHRSLFSSILNIHSLTLDSYA